MNKLKVKLNKLPDFNYGKTPFHRCPPMQLDVNLLVEAQCIKASGAVLSSFSDFLREKFHQKTSSYRKRTKIVPLQGVRAYSVRSLVQFMNTGRIRLNGRNVMDILKAADLLGLADVKQECCKFLLKTLAIETCFVLHKVASANHCVPFLQDITNFMSMNMAQIITSQLFLDYPIEHITLCISLVNKGMEEEMCRALLQWAARANRNKEMATLLGKLNFKNISTPFILDVLCKDSTIKGTLASSNFLVDVVSSRLRVEQRRNAARPARCDTGSEVNKCTNTMLCGETGQDKLTGLICMGGAANTHHIKYDFKSDDWSNIWADSTEMHTEAAVGVGKTVYCFSEYFHSMYKINPQGKLQQLAKPPTSQMKRKFAAVTADRGIIYLVGGCDSRGCSLPCVSQYFTEENQWNVLPHMNQARQKHQIAMCNGQLFALGGTDKYGVLSTVERFDFESQKWKFVNCMLSPRARFAAVAVGLKIYVVAGTADGECCLRSAEVFNTMQGCWMFIRSLRVGRMSLAGCTIGGRVYIVGGQGGHFNDKRKQKIMDDLSVQCYSPSTNEWSNITNLKKQFFIHSVIPM